MKMNKNLRKAIKVITFLYLIFICSWGMLLPIILFTSGDYIYATLTIAIGIVSGFIYDAIEKAELREKAELIQTNIIDWEFPWLNQKNEN